ncbi:dynein regulatory complex protein 9 [Brachionichthys hirsutus]|uniref:dynein regulatory complex protein 9 n=1 Tax=Brachionichthys hirsutus TaxID=412623 RepID=UPI0036043BAA
MSLSYIESVLMAAVLEDCSDQLSILGHTLTERIDCSRERADLQYISQHISKLYLELQEKQSFSSLQQTLTEEKQKQKSLITERDEKRELELKHHTLNSLHEEAQQKIEKLQDMDHLIKELKHQLNEESTKFASSERIEKSYEEMQVQEARNQSLQAEKLLSDQVELRHQQLEDTNRCQEMVMIFLHNQHEKFQQELQQWQQQAEQMPRQKQQQLNNVLCKRTVIADRLQDTKEKIRDMEQMVMEDREEQEKLRQLQVKASAATKLQAWWRGCMVRRGLGSFKKKEIKKGKKKKGKKKK